MRAQLFGQLFGQLSSDESVPQVVTLVIRHGVADSVPRPPGSQDGFLIVQKLLAQILMIGWLWLMKF